MSHFHIAFSADNACFEDAPAEEIGRILRDLADKVEAGRDGGRVIDRNGNTVGTWDWHQEEQ